MNTETVEIIMFVLIGLSYIIVILYTLAILAFLHITFKKRITRIVRPIYRFLYKETAPIIGIGWTIGIAYYLMHMVK